MFTAAGLGCLLIRISPWLGEDGREAYGHVAKPDAGCALVLAHVLGVGVLSYAEEAVQGQHSGVARGPEGQPCVYMCLLPILGPSPLVTGLVGVVFQKTRTEMAQDETTRPY